MALSTPHVYFIHQLLSLRDIPSNDIIITLKSQKVQNCQTKKYQGYVKTYRKGYKYIDCNDIEYLIQYNKSKVYCYKKQIIYYNNNDFVSFVVFIVNDKPYAKDICKIITEPKILTTITTSVMPIMPIMPIIPLQTTFLKTKVYLNHDKDYINSSAYYEFNFDNFHKNKLSGIITTDNSHENKLKINSKRYNGIVKCYWEDKNHGFIACDDPDYWKIFGIRGNDAFLHKHQRNSCSCHVGDLVSFIVDMVNNQPQARNVKIISKRYKGIIKTYNDNEGFGTITCSDNNYIKVFCKKEPIFHEKQRNTCKYSHVYYAIDPFLHHYKQEYTQCNIGDLVSFIIDIVNEQPIARNIYIESKRYLGIIKVYNEDNGFGFITCTDDNYIKVYGNKDPFLHKKQKESCQCHVGDLISFIIDVVNEQPQARIISLESKRYKGTLLSDDKVRYITCVDENYIKVYGNKHIYLDNL